MRRLLVAALLSACASAPAHAGELFGGIYVHDVKTPLDLSGIEPGLDLHAGYRGGRIGKTPLQAYGLFGINTAGETSYAAVGLSARFGARWYVRPGLGIAIHNGSDGSFARTNRVAFGSRILFEPELGVGMQVSDRLSVEASLVHLSHGQIFNSRQNPGIDNLGVRVNLKL